MTDLRKKTKYGILWNAVEKFGVQGVSFILNIILARLLMPSDYGLLGLLTVFLAFSNVFIDSGFSRALIQFQNRSEADFSTVFIFNTLISVLLYLVLFFCAPLVASFFKIQLLVRLQRVLFLVLILQALIVVQNTKLQIAVDFKKLALINFFTVLLGGAAGIYAAFYGLGVWALVIQQIVKNLIALLLYWSLGRWYPSARFSFESFKKLFTFGSKLLISGLLSTTVNNIDSLIIGKLYNPKSLGYYTRAQQFPEIISGTLAGVLGTVTFPLMASLQNDSENLKVIFKRLIKLTVLLVFPAMLGLAFLSKNIILVLLGTKWLPVSEYLFWLSLSYIFTPLSIINLNIMNAIGRSDLFLKVDFFKLPIIFLVMAITFPISLKAVVIGRCCAAFVYYYVNSFVPGSMYDFGAFKQLYSAWKGIFAGCVMGMVIFFISLLIEAPLINLIVSISLGIIVYIAVLMLLREEELMYIFRKIKIS